LKGSSCISCGKEGNTVIKQEKGRRVATKEPKGFIGSSKATTKATRTTLATSDLNLNGTTTKAAMTIAKINDNLHVSHQALAMPK